MNHYIRIKSVLEKELNRKLKLKNSLLKFGYKCNVEALADLCKEIVLDYQSLEILKELFEVKESEVLV